MPGNLLAEEYVRIVAEGMEEADAKTDALGKKFDRMGQSARMAEAFVAKLSKTLAAMASGPSRLFAGIEAGVRRLGDTVNKIVTPLKSFALGGALGIGGIAAGAMSGTVEAERLGKAWEYLSRTVGDRLAPYVRGLTNSIIELTRWFSSLSDATKDNIVQWGLIATGIGAIAALIPVVIAGVAGIVGAFAALTSPIMLTIAAVAGLTVAAVMLFDYFSGGSKDAADNINAANKNWVDNLFAFIQNMAAAFAKFFNWVFAQWQHLERMATRLAATIAELTGKIDKATRKQIFADLLKERDNAKPLINLDNLRANIDAAKGVVKQKVPEIQKIFDEMAGLGGRLKAAFAKGGPGGFHIKMNVGWESLQGTFDRLQKAFADQSGMNIEKAQLGQLEQINKGQQAAVAGLQKISELLPVVR